MGEISGRDAAISEMKCIALCRCRYTSGAKGERFSGVACVKSSKLIHGIECWLIHINSNIPLFDRKRLYLRPDLPSGRAPRAAAVKDAAAAAAPAEPARSVLDRASTVLG